MTELSACKDLLTDSFERVRDLVAETTSGLTLEVSGYRPDPDSNSIGWLIWHLSRIQDDHLAELAGEPQAWASWRERFDLPFDELATGYGQTTADVAAVRVPAELLAGYHADVHAATQRYVDRLTEEELARVVDERWDPPVTASVRLVSVIGDCLQHLGQAAYVRSLAERALKAGG